MLRTGLARREITPPLGIPHLAHEPRMAPFAGVHDPLYARALVLESDDARLGLLAIDARGISRGILGPERDFIAELRARVAEATGIPPAHLMLAASHAHSTPQTTHLTDLVGDCPAARDWLERLQDELAAVVAEAASDMHRARLLDAGAAAVPINRNRRKHLSSYAPVDPRLSVLALMSDDGPLGIVAHYACHPVTVQVQPLVSADFPGVMCAYMEQMFPESVCLFLQGAAGDVNPVNGTTHFDDVAKYGLALGEAAEELLGPTLANGGGDPNPILAAAVEVEEIPFRDDLPSLAEANGDPDARRLLELAQDSVPAEVQALRLGDVALLGVPGELFCELGLEIEGLSAAPQTRVIGCANDYVGYLPPFHAYEEGGYETALGPWTLVAPYGGELVVVSATGLLRELWQS